MGLVKRRGESYRNKEAAESDRTFVKSLGPDFAKVKAEWDRRLTDSGLDDIEAPSKALRPNLRTVAFENRDAIRDFFLALDSYLARTVIPPRDRKVLEAYSAGQYIGKIAESLSVSRSTVKNTIRHYRSLVTGILPSTQGPKSLNCVISSVHVLRRKR